MSQIRFAIIQQKYRLNQFKVNYQQGWGRVHGSALNTSMRTCFLLIQV